MKAVSPAKEDSFMLGFQADKDNDDLVKEAMDLLLKINEQKEGAVKAFGDFKKNHPDLETYLKPYIDKAKEISADKKRPHSDLRDKDGMHTPDSSRYMVAFAWNQPKLGSLLQDV